METQLFNRGARTPACRVHTHVNALSVKRRTRASARVPTRHAGVRAPQGSLNK
jgi:hypothetical protein